MEIAQLKALLSLREFSSLVRVGEHLHLSPSAVFCQIRQLEEETGNKLYERIGKRLTLTEAGLALSEHASAVLDAHDIALADLRSRTIRHTPVLRIGCGPHGSVRIAPYLFQSFLKSYPDTEIRLATSDDQSLIRELRLGLLDVVLMSLPTNDRHLHEEPLWSYTQVFVLPPSNKKVRNPRHEAVEKLPFILYRRTVLIDSILTRWRADLGFELKIVMENDEVDSIKEMVKLGLGFALLPYWSVSDEVEKGNLRILWPKQQEFHDYGLLSRKAGYQPNALSALTRVARRWIDWWPFAKAVRAPIDRTRTHGTTGKRAAPKLPARAAI
jgi:DNA-binding transcriptional LysR family regulator